MNNEIRELSMDELDDEKLDTVLGGFINDIHLPTVAPAPPPTLWTFKDPFAKWTIGH